MKSFTFKIFLVLLNLILVLTLPGCVREELPGAELEKEMGDEPVPEMLATVLLLTLELEPTSHYFSFSGNGRFFSYDRAAQAPVSRIMDLESREYPLEPEEGTYGIIAWV